MKPRIVVTLCFVAWLVFFVSPRTVMPLGLAAYIALVFVLGWSALRHRSKSWASGLLFAVMLVTLPVWVLGGYWCFELLLPTPGTTVPSFRPF